MLVSQQRFLKRIINGTFISFGLLMVILIVVFFKINSSGVPTYTLNGYTTNEISGEEILIRYPFFRNKLLDNKINEIINELKKISNYIDYDIYFIDDNYVNVFFNIGKQKYVYRSYLLSIKNGTEENIDTIIEKNKLNEIAMIALDSKYPKFIVEALSGKGNIAYKIKETVIGVYYSDFSITPEPNVDIFVTISNQNLKDVLKYNYKIDSNYQEDNLFRLDENKKTVAFTFDDGPSLVKTENILAILEDNKMQATFFMVGEQMEKYPAIVKNVFASGNEIGSHTYAHKYLTSLNKTKLDYEINRVNEIYKSIIGENLRLLRPPYGNLNDKIRQNYDFSFILWSVDPRDWEIRDARKVAEHILNNIQDGDIILLHDLYVSTVEALRIVLPELYVRGYQVVSVSQLAELKNQQIADHNVYKFFK